jgi:hypothetical protein
MLLLEKEYKLEGHLEGTPERSSQVGFSIISV